MRALQGSSIRKLMSNEAGNRLLRKLNSWKKLPSGTKVTAHPDADKNIDDFIDNMTL